MRASGEMQASQRTRIPPQPLDLEIFGGTEIELNSLCSFERVSARGNRIPSGSQGLTTADSGEVVVADWESYGLKDSNNLKERTTAYRDKSRQMTLVFLFPLSLA